MPENANLLDDVFDTSSDTYEGDFANVPGQSDNIPSDYANVPTAAAPFQPASPTSGNAPRSNALLGAHRPPDDYANLRGPGPASAPPPPVTPLRQPQGYGRQIPASGAVAGRVQARGDDLLLNMQSEYKDENRKLQGAHTLMKYVDDWWTRWDKYGVKLGTPMTRRGMVFDTETVKKHFFDKNDGALSGSLFGKSLRTGKDFPWPEEWAQKGMIWVCMRHPVTGRAQFYSHVSKRRVKPGGKGYNFGHSSLTAGGEVIAAGEWIVENGRLLGLSANSGHYQPTLKFLHQAAQHLKPVITGDTYVYLFNHIADEWQNYPALEFLTSPTGNGRYWAHPYAKG